MMVTGLPFPLKSSPVDGLLTKSQLQDSEMIQPISFGEILRAKEKQLEQEINVSSAVVALAAMQTSFVTMPIPEQSISEENYKADIRPALEKGLPKQLSAQPPSKAMSSQIENNTETGLIEIQKDEALVNPSATVSTGAPSTGKPAENPEVPAAGNVVLTQNPSSRPSVVPGDSSFVPNAGKPNRQDHPPSNVPDVSRLQNKADQGSHVASRTIVNSESIVLPVMTKLDQTAKNTAWPIKLNAQIELTQRESPRQVGPKTSPEHVAKPLEAKVPGTEIAAPRLNTRKPVIEVPSITTTEELEIPSAEVKAKQTKIFVETNTENVNPSVSTTDFGISQMVSHDLQAPAGHNRIYQMETLEKQENPTMPFAEPVQSAVHPVEFLADSIDDPEKQSSSALRNGAHPTSPASEAVIAGAKQTAPQANPIKPIAEILQPEADESAVSKGSSEIYSESKSVETANQAVVEPVFAQRETEQESITVKMEVASPAHEDMPRTNTASHPSFDEIPASFSGDIEAEPSKPVKQSKLSDQTSNTGAHQPANDSVTSESGINQDNINDGVMRPERQGNGIGEPAVSKGFTSPTNTDHKVQVVHTQTAFDQEISVKTSVEIVSNVSSTEYEGSAGESIADAVRAEKQTEVSAQVTENMHSVVQNEKAFADSIDRRALYTKDEVDTELRGSSGNTTTETPERVPDTDRAISLVGKSHPERERPNVETFSSAMGSAHVDRDIAAQTTFQAEASSLPLEKPEFGSGVASSSNKQEPAASEAEVVAAQPKSSEASNQLPQSNAGVARTTEEVLAQPAFQTTFLNSRPNAEHNQGFESQRSISFRTETNASQTSFQIHELPQFRADEVFIAEQEAVGNRLEVSHQAVISAQASESEALLPTPGLLGTEPDGRIASEIDVIEQSIEGSDQSAQQPKVPQAPRLPTESDVQGALPARMKSDSPSSAPLQAEVELKKNVDDSQSLIEKQINQVGTRAPQTVLEELVPPSSTGSPTEVIRAETPPDGQSTLAEVTNLDISEVAPLQTEIDAEKQIANSENVEMPVGVDEWAVNNWRSYSDVKDTAQPASFSGNEQQMEDVSPQSVLSANPYSANSHMALPEVDAAPRHAEVQEEGSGLRFINVETQIGPQPPVATISYSSPANVVENEILQSITQDDSSRAVSSDLPKDAEVARSLQPEIHVENQFASKPVIDLHSTEKQIEVDEIREGPRFVSEILTGSPETFVDSEARSISRPTFTQRVASTNTNSDRSETLSFATEAEPSKVVVDSENVQKQVITKATVDTHTKVKPTEKTDFDSIASSTLGTNPQDAISDIPVREFDDARRSDAKDAQPREVALPRSPAGSQGTQVSLKPEVYVNEDPGRQELRAEQTYQTDEKIHPVEKEYKPNEIAESASHVATPHKEAVVVGAVEKGPAVLVNLHAVEIVQQVIRQLSGRIKSGPTSMRLQLNPEKLGAIDVEMIRDSQGVSVTFFAEQANTGKLLETQLNQLRQSLVDSGVQLSGLNIGQHGHTGQEGGFQHQNTNFAETSQHESFHTEVSTKEHPRAEQVTRQTSEVDYRI